MAGRCLSARSPDAITTGPLDAPSLLSQGNPPDHLRFRAAVVLLILAGGWLTRGLWTPAVGRGLVCQTTANPSGEALLLENFDLTYLLFERAAAIRKGSTSPRVLVPVEASPDPAQANEVFAGIVEVMARVARLGPVEVIPVRESEPVSLNTAYQVRDFLKKEGIRSVLVIAPGLRSRRSSLVYDRVFGDAGIATQCLPVFGEHTPDTWTATSHGVEHVLEQYVKLAYYRLFILPRVPARRS